MTVRIPIGQIAIRALSAQPIDMLRNCIVIWSPNNVSRGARSVKILFEKSLPGKPFCEVFREYIGRASIAGAVPGHAGAQLIDVLRISTLTIGLQLEVPLVNECRNSSIHF